MSEFSFNSIKNKLLTSESSIAIQSALFSQALEGKTIGVPYTGLDYATTEFRLICQAIGRAKCHKTNLEKGDNYFFNTSEGDTGISAGIFKGVSDIFTRVFDHYEAATRCGCKVPCRMVYCSDGGFVWEHDVNIMKFKVGDKVTLKSKTGIITTRNDIGTEYEIVESNPTYVMDGLGYGVADRDINTWPRYKVQGTSEDGLEYNQTIQECDLEKTVRGILIPGPFSFNDPISIRYRYNRTSGFVTRVENPITNFKKGDPVEWTHSYKGEDKVYTEHFFEYVNFDKNDFCNLDSDGTCSSCHKSNCRKVIFALDGKHSGGGFMPECKVSLERVHLTDFQYGELLEWTFTDLGCNERHPNLPFLRYEPRSSDEPGLTPEGWCKRCKEPGCRHVYFSGGTWDNGHMPECKISKMKPQFGVGDKVVITDCSRELYKYKATHKPSPHDFIIGTVGVVEEVHTKSTDAFSTMSYTIVDSGDTSWTVCEADLKHKADDKPPLGTLRNPIFDYSLSSLHPYTRSFDFISYAPTFDFVPFETNPTVVEPKFKKGDKVIHEGKVQVIADSIVRYEDNEMFYGFVGGLERYPEADLKKFVWRPHSYAKRRFILKRLVDSVGKVTSSKITSNDSTGTETYEFKHWCPPTVKGKCIEVGSVKCTFSTREEAEEIIFHYQIGSFSHPMIASWLRLIKECYKEEFPV